MAKSLEKQKKWREKKQRQREKTKLDQAKQDKIKSTDRLRKAKEREMTRKMAAKDPDVLEEKRKRKRAYQQRFREKQRLLAAANQPSTSTQNISNRQLTAAEKKKKKKKAEGMKALRQKRKYIEQKKKEVRRMQEYRLRVKLQDPKSTSINEDKAAYKSRWTEWRAVKRAKNALSSTPIKRAKIVEKILDSPNSNPSCKNQGGMPTRDTMEKAHIGEAFLSSFKEKLEEVKQREDVWNRRKMLT